MERRKARFTYNRAGVAGWYGGRAYNIERFLYLLHRITGIGLVAFLFLHITLTSSRISHDLWLATESFLHTPLSHIGMLIVIAGLLFHGLNGIRLIINEYGFVLGKPARPVYPYRKVLRTKGPRALLAIMVVVGVVLFAAAIYEIAMAWGV